MEGTELVYHVFSLVLLRVLAATAERVKKGDRRHETSHVGARFSVRGYVDLSCGHGVGKL